MKQHGAEAVELGAGFPVRLSRGGVLQPITRDPLSEAQFSALLKEIAPAELAGQVGSQAPLRFGYASPVGAIEGTLEPKNGASTATLRPAAADQAAPPPASPASAGELAEARQDMDRLFRRLVESGGSDLHLRTGAIPLIRKDGVLVRLDEPALDAARIELLLRSIMTEGDYDSYRSDNDHDWAWEVEGVSRFRCNAGRDRFGPMAVFRTIPTSIRTAQDLGLSKEVQALCNLTKGLVLVTGPTGSGKSTTLAAMVDLVNRNRTDHIITIEDPIEFVHQSKRCLVTQRQVGIHTNSFKEALRAALREDPDVVLVGEMRDLETIAIAIETAETGPLVFGTLHTTTAISTVERLVDQFPGDRQEQVRMMLADSLKAVIAQTLLKKVGGGRVAAQEILLANPAVSNLIREGKTFQLVSAMQTGRAKGMILLNDALLDLVKRGLVAPEEAWLKAVDKENLAKAFAAANVELQMPVAA